MEFETIIGTLGAGIILVAFLLNQTGKIDRESISYDALNSIGGSLLILYAYLIPSWPFLILNGIWTCFSLKDVVVGLKNK